MVANANSWKVVCVTPGTAKIWFTVFFIFVCDIGKVLRSPMTCLKCDFAPAINTLSNQGQHLILTRKSEQRTTANFKEKMLTAWYIPDIFLLYVDLDGRKPPCYSLLNQMLASFSWLAILFVENLPRYSHCQLEFSCPTSTESWYLYKYPLGKRYHWPKQQDMKSLAMH